MGEKRTQVRTGTRRHLRTNVIEKQIEETYFEEKGFLKRGASQGSPTVLDVLTEKFVWPCLLFFAAFSLIFANVSGDILDTILDHLA